MKHKLRAMSSVVIASAAWFGLISPASGAPVFEHGSECSPTTSSEVSKVAYGTTGIRNALASGTALVSCPFGALGTGTTTNVTLRVLDGSSTADVSCTMFALTNGGDVIWSQTKNTAGASGGAGVDLNFAIPANITNRAAYAQCSLPVASSVATVIRNP